MPGSAWADAWADAWGDSWGTVGVTPPTPPVELNPSNLDGHVRMYGGSAYRPRDEDVADLLKLLFPRKRKKKRLAAKDLEAAAVAVMNMTSPPSPAVRSVIVDFVKPLLDGQARQAETRMLIEALLTKAAEVAAREKAIEIEQDDDDVLLLLLH